MSALDRGFREGAQACREMLARFVEQGGDPTTAASIRANWSPSWGEDPGPPTPAEARAVYPAGWLVVPIEPSDEMIEAAEEEMASRRQHGCTVYAGDVWTAMLRALPTPPKVEAE